MLVGTSTVRRAPEPGVQVQPPERDQPAPARSRSGHDILGVHLRYLIAGCFADVGDGEGQPHDPVGRDIRWRDLEVAVLEGGVAQAVPEGEDGADRAVDVGAALEGAPVRGGGSADRAQERDR